MLFQQRSHRLDEPLCAAEFKNQLAKQDVRLVQLKTNAEQNEPRLELIRKFMQDLEAIAREQGQSEEKQRKYAD